MHEIAGGRRETGKALDAGRKADYDEGRECAGS